MSKVQPEYICSCFFTQNIFIKKYKIHVKYINDDQFENEFRQVLRMKGCSTTNQYEEALYEVHKEVSLRKSYHKKFLDNYLYIQRHYTKLYPDIWTLRQTFLDSRFLTIAAEAKKPTQTKESLLSCIMHNGGDITECEVYKMPIFTTELCLMLINEIQNFNNFPCEKTRPNTMNKYGISLDEMGLSQGLLIPLIADYLQFIAKCLFPQWTGHAIDSFKAFVVKYESDLDTELSKHFDNAEVTMNISLNSKFEGGDLQFYSSSLNRSVDISHESNLQMSHKEGYGVMHCGRQYHSALPIIAGIRYNLIIWMRSSTVRNICPMCNQTPDLVQVPIAGDGFIPIPKTRSQCHLL
ncbi:2-oxoglutarate and iron-dependent oxygenase domain-containing protein 2-like isoform X2 [Biomphalaria glabrata]|nr:2-oxoglutarate and iron-dependent oxygenase domain-containing protein 2-like isoform X2 [Biomphalaria glabrata]XP_055865480.1 2-oxoglutarate and iron-dependent oxygenase domain-containing protein 2-like isoform X2 [Biomphalaria glabrata]XP_055865490.1 2-oxoglutarate and iron-dependent oxygenase domain-containing protein 2-like isoform X2 [Biomphalaria glabrata]XP_055865504.1 2-oxoglutarate and iron-dependent oxygenase domain-containing protein 2-like isoform X2 [Biomphalaria glabrata]XP_0558